MSLKALRMKKELSSPTRRFGANHAIKISTQVYFLGMLTEVNSRPNYNSQNAKWPKLTMKASVLKLVKLLD